MEVPVCFSQYFVDKQNVRSYSNIIKTKLLKTDDITTFVLDIFEDESTVEELSSDFLTMFNILRSNLRIKSKEDFKNYFACDQSNKNADLEPVSKNYIFTNSLKALRDIIPKNFFGVKNNSKIFDNLVETIVHSMKRQHINLGKNIVKWDLSVDPWKSVSEVKSTKILYHVLIWVFQYILSGIICLNFYATTCKIDSDENKLFYFKINEWQSFYDKKISSMISKKIIKRCESYCSGTKCKRNYSYKEKTRLKTFRKDIPKLHLVLKNNNNYRPIVRYKNNTLTTSEKYKIKDRLEFLKLLTGKFYKKTEFQFYNIYQEWLKLNKPKLYFVKADLSNAFGSINRRELMRMLDESYMNVMKNENFTGSRERAKQQYKDMIRELRKPILVRAGSTVYEWRTGLVQGYKYSPALSELYYGYLDELYFSDHLKNSVSQIRLFTRVVDDYLYITDSLPDAESFLAALSQYKNVNYEKTVVNFPHVSVKFSDQMTFLGYCYDTKLIRVSRASNIYLGQMCYKISFSQAIINVTSFLEQRIGQSSIHVNSHIFNLYYNNEEQMWHHVFTTVCIAANKFCTILAILCDTNEMKNHLILYKKRVTVRLCNAIIDSLIKNKPANVHFLYCINHFRYLSWKALSLCAQKTSKCNMLLSYINDEMCKADCIFGKWKEHASRIGSNGALLRPAVKEVCRRADWKIIMRKFATLPEGFQCYNRRKIMNYSI